MSKPEKGMALLQEAIERIERGQEQYGTPAEMFDRVAEVWSGVLGIKVKGQDVPRCLIGFKLVRWAITDDEDVVKDSCKDIGGYSGAGWDARPDVPKKKGDSDG